MVVWAGVIVIARVHFINEPDAAKAHCAVVGYSKESLKVNLWFYHMYFSCVNFKGAVLELEFPKRIRIVKRRIRIPFFQTILDIRITDIRIFTK